MPTRTVRDTEIALPDDDPDDLDPIDRLPRDEESITEAVIRGEVWARATINGLTLRRSWLSGADLAGVTIAESTFDRCVFTGCTLVGADVHTLTLRDVIFENCRLDYATLQRVKTASPVAFLGCSLVEATFAASALSFAVFDGCKFIGLLFSESDLRGADVRGNDLSGLTSATALRGATLSGTQVPSFTDLVLRELAMTIAGG
jgi:uncharacterized protein YjbI with pentapeptide repeats